MLARLPAADHSAAIFALVYALALATLVRLARDTPRLIVGLYAYAALTLMRLFTILAVPLSPPRDLVALSDPFVRAFEGGRDVTKDLFFSGHVATACLFVLLWRGSRARPLVAAAAGVLAALVLVQRVHYAVDVAAAPVFAWLAFRTGERLGTGG